MNSALPLSGKRIMITRARRQASRLAEVLEAKGAIVLRLPTIEIIPPESYGHFDAMLAAIESFDWLIVTSANGAAALADRLQLLDIPLQRLKHLQVAAIGPATAAALARSGVQVSVTPQEYVAESVVSMLKDKVMGRRVLLARAAVARDFIPGQLRQYGADINVAETYRTVIPAESIDEAAQLLGEGKPLPDAVTFTSASTVNHFISLLAAADVELPSGLRAVSIGPVTTAALRQHNWEPAREAAPFDIPGLVEACINLLHP